MEPCRKCGTPNPKSNQYCLSCGAVLAVATALVRDQPKTLIPLTNHFRWKWVFLGALVITGVVAIALVGVGIAVAVNIGSALGQGSLTSMGARAPGLAIGAAAAFLIAFSVGGFVVARMSRGRTVAEPAVASLLVLALLGGTSTALSPDAILVAAILALPCVLMAALGGWFGEISEKKEPEI